MFGLSRAVVIFSKAQCRSGAPVAPFPDASQGQVGDSRGGPPEVCVKFVGMLCRVLGVLLLIAGSARAQDDSRGEVSFGWRYYHAAFSNALFLGISGPVRDFPKGGYADVAINVSEKFAVVGEAGGTLYDTSSETGSGTFVSIRRSNELRLYSFMGGIRVRAPQHRAAVPFGQLLVGGQRSTTEFEQTVRVQNQAPSTSRNENSFSDPVLALDGGVTFMAGPVGVRASAGYVRFFGQTDADAFRVAVGAAFRF
jgi:hypothetical protein